VGKILPDAGAASVSAKPFIGKFGADFVFSSEKLNVFGFSLTKPDSAGCSQGVGFTQVGLTTFEGE
jgi:hypothetical protein